MLCESAFRAVVSVLCVSGATARTPLPPPATATSAPSSLAASAAEDAVSTQKPRRLVQFGKACARLWWRARNNTLSRVTCGASLAREKKRFLSGSRRPTLPRLSVLRRVHRAANASVRRDLVGVRQVSTRRPDRLETTVEASFKNQMEKNDTSNSRVRPAAATDGRLGNIRFQIQKSSLVGNSERVSRE